MKLLKYILLFLVIQVPLFGISQVKTASTLIRIETPKYIKYEDPYIIYVPMNFNNAEVQSRIKDLDIDQVVSVSLIYSQFRASERFDQLELNNKRTYELNRLIPGLASNTNISWYWIAQTGCKSPSECNNYFHGFEIKIKSPKEIETEIFEKKMLEYYTKSAIGEETSSAYLDSVISTGTSSLVKTCDTSFQEKKYSRSKLGTLTPLRTKSDKKFLRKLRKLDLNGDESIKFIVTDRRKIINIEGLEKKNEFSSLAKENFKLIPSRYKGQRVYTQYQMTFNRSGKKLNSYNLIATPITKNKVQIDSFYSNIEYVEVIKCSYMDTSVRLMRSSTIGYGYNSAIEDVITKVFDRNKHWTNCVIATDVTGSMAPYLGQFLAWHQLNMKSHTNNNYIFFNDGNNMADQLKRPGKVGGIYHTKTTSFETMSTTLHKAQSRGGGGDLPENNIEACITGLKANPDANGIIMIADNYATPRDLNLLNKVNKPIHVILCGASYGINTAYLNMIRENGGTLHTIEDDLTNLAKLHEGEEIEILGVSYIIEHGKFVPHTAKRDITVRL